MDEVLRPRDWTEEELREAGFRYFMRRKQLVLAGRLPVEHAPLEIHYPLEVVIADAGDVIWFCAARQTEKTKAAHRAIVSAKQLAITFTMTTPPLVAFYRELGYPTHFLHSLPL